MGGQVLGGGPHGAREKHVVGVQPHENLAGGLLKAAVQSVGRPLVLARKILQAAAVALKDLQSCVGRAAIHHDVLDARVVLGNHALDGFGQVRRRVIGRSDDAYQGQFGGIHG